MIKQVLSGAATLALIAGVSFAQDVQSTTQQRTVIDRPNGDDTVNTRTTVHTNDDGDHRTVSHDVVRNTDGYGDQSVTSKTTRTNNNGYGDQSSSTTVQRTTTDK